MPYVSCTKLETEVAALQTQIDALSGSTGITAVSHDATLTGDGNTTQLSVAQATDSQRGAVELATSAEAIAGTSTTTAVTPAGVAAAIASGVPTATDSVAGKVELATTAEATAGTSSTLAVTPAGLKAALDAAAPNLVDSQGNALAADACVLKCPTTAGTAGQVLTAQADGSTLWTTPSSGGGGSGITAVSHDATLSGDGNTTQLSVVSATDSQKGAVETATSAEIGAGTQTGSSGPLVMTPDDTITALNDTATAGGNALQKAVVNAVEQALSSDAGATAAIAAAVVPSIPTATESTNGTIQLATTAEAQAWTDDTTAITPAKLDDAFQGGNQSLGALGSSGYQKLPGGLIMQWSTITTTDITGETTCLFPISFPNNVINVQATIVNGNGSPVALATVGAVVNAGANIGVYDLTGARTTQSVFVVAYGR